MTLLIFDCDGTLVDSEPLHAKVEVAMMRERFGLEADVKEHYRRFTGMGTKPVYDWIEQVSGNKVPPEFELDLAQRKQDVFSKETRAVPHMAETLDILKDTPRCIASNTRAEVVRAALASAGLLDRFPHIFSTQMVARPKPDPDIFLYAAQQMGAVPQDCIVIEDSKHGVAAARAAGMRVFGYTGGSHYYPGYEELLRDAELIFSDMRELPRLIQTTRKPAKA